MIFTVPNSWGTVREFNTCHDPKDGKFAGREVCPLSVQPMAHDLLVKRGIDVEPVPDTVKRSGAMWFLHRDADTNAVLGSSPLALKLGTEGTDAMIQTVFKHEAGHFLTGHRRTRNWVPSEVRIAGVPFSKEYANEVLAWAKGIGAWPNVPVQWSAVRAGLGSYLAHDMEFHNMVYFEYAKKHGMLGKTPPENYFGVNRDLEPKFRAFKNKKLRQTLDTHMSLLRRLHRMAQQRKARAA